MNFHSTYLGFRADALHPRLYAAARIRGLRTRQNVGNDKDGALSHVFLRCAPSLFRGNVARVLLPSREDDLLDVRLKRNGHTVNLARAIYQECNLRPSERSRIIGYLKDVVMIMLQGAGQAVEIDL